MKSVYARLRSANGAASSQQRGRRGGTLVEFAIIASLAWSFVFGILEFSWLATTRGSLLNGVARAARMGSVGQPLNRIRQELRTGTQLTIPDRCITVEYNLESDGSGRWVAVQDDPTSGLPPAANLVPTGKPLRVQVADWPYPMITGSFFGWLPQVRDGKLPMTASATTRRE